MPTDLEKVLATFDDIGIEPGDLDTRLTYLRGAAKGFSPVRRVVIPTIGPATTIRYGGQADAAHIDTEGFARWAVSAAGLTPPSRSDWDECDSIALERAEAEAPPKPGHHESWSANRRAFFASLSAAGIHEPYETIAAYCQSMGAPRPSGMNQAQRLGFMVALTMPAQPGEQSALERFRNWAIHRGKQHAG